MICSSALQIHRFISGERSELWAALEGIEMAKVAGIDKLLAGCGDAVNVIRKLC